MNNFSHTAVRHLIQLFFVGTCIWVGWQFYHFLLWATQNSDVFVPRPAGVEAFLPIAALASTKRLLLTGQWDPVHPAGLSVFLGAILLSALLRKGFCGYVCPVGFFSTVLGTLSTKSGVAKRVSPRVASGLRMVKYLLLAFFVKIILIDMSVADISNFIMSTYNLSVDATMLLFFIRMTQTSAVVLLILLILSTIFPHFFCRFVCPYGALLGVFSRWSPARVTRQRECRQCRACDHACPQGIPVSRMEEVVSTECTGCLTCIQACTGNNMHSSLHIAFLKKKVRPVAFSMCVLLFCLLVYVVARHAGLWENAMPQEMLRRIYPVIPL